MKVEKEQTKDGGYLSPRVEWTEVAVEAGFQASLEGIENEGYSVEDGSWDM